MTKLDRSIIHQLPIFSAMDDSELDDVISRATSQHIPKGTAVFQQGDDANDFFVLLHGRLKVVKVTAHGLPPSTGSPHVGLPVCVAPPSSLTALGSKGVGGACPASALGAP